MKISVKLCHKNEEAIADIEESESFYNLLILFQSAFGTDSICAFEYTDEDADIITVRSEKEMPVFLVHLLEAAATGVEVTINGRSADDRSRVEDLALSLPVASCVESSPRSDGPSSDLRYVDTTLSSGASNNASNSASATTVSISVKPHHMSASPKDTVTDAMPLNNSFPSPYESCFQPLETLPPQRNSSNIAFENLCIVSEIGKGNFGTVYHAVLAGSDTHLAVKCIRLDVSEQTQKQIASEFEILHMCASNFIIRFHGSFFTENQINLCMEFMDGGSLSNYGLIENELVLGAAVFSVTHGLRYLWSMRILHRDVKPSNILVNSAGDIKLCDFGVSTQLVRSIAQTFVGTVAYMAPERLRGEQYNELADVWSLGMSVFELATGRLPYSQDVCSTVDNGTGFSMQLVYQLSAQSLVSLRSIQNGRRFSNEMVDFVDNCVQRDVKKRLQPLVLHAHPFVVQHGDTLTNSQVVVQWLQGGNFASTSR